MTLAQKLVTLHRAMEAQSIPHAFGGAIALAYWTLDPRGTSDIDVNVFVAAERCQTALEALPAAVSTPDGVAQRIAEEGQVRLWWEGTPLDLFFDYEPVHEAAARNSRTVPFAGEEISVLGPVELAVFKVMFDRTRDWADIEAMLTAQTLDAEAVREQLTEMVGAGDPRLVRLAATVASIESLRGPDL